MSPRGGPRVTDVGPRLRRRRRRSAVVVAIRVLLVAVVVAAVAGATWLVGFSSVLAVREVRVTGVGVLDADDVRTAAAVPLGTPLARIDLGAVRARVADLAPVAEATVERSWPNAVTVTVIERTPVLALDRGDDGTWLVDASGLAYLEVDRAPDGLVVADPEDDAVVPEIAAAVSRMPASLLAAVDRVGAESPDSIEFRLDGGRTLVWGDAERSEQKAAVAEVLLRQPGKRYDVSAPDRPAVR